MLEEIFEALLPLVLEAVSVLLALLLGWLAVQLRRRYGIQIEAAHRDALHTALMSGVSRAIELGLDRRAIADEALAYAKRSVPDAIAALRAEDDLLRDLAVAKLGELLDGRGRAPA